MGGRLVSEAVSLMAMGLIRTRSRGSRLVLLSICSVARDTDQKNVQAGIYFGGWEYLSGCLGYPKPTETAKRGTQKALSDLVDVGLLEPQVEHAHAGIRQVYKVTLPKPWTL